MRFHQRHRSHDRQIQRTKGATAAQEVLASLPCRALAQRVGKALEVHHQADALTLTVQVLLVRRSW